MLCSVSDGQPSCGRLHVQQARERSRARVCLCVCHCVGADTDYPGTFCLSHLIARLLPPALPDGNRHTQKAADISVAWQPKYVAALSARLTPQTSQHNYIPEIYQCGYIIHMVCEAHQVMFDSFLGLQAPYKMRPVMQNTAVLCHV